MCINCLTVSRRAMLAGSGALAASLATGVAEARIRPQDMTPLIGPGYQPTDKDEIGIWQLMDRVEEEVSGSNLLIKDPGTNAYVKDLIGRINLMFQLVPLALQTDSTRLITILIQGRGDVPEIPGVRMDHHNLSHHGQDPQKIEQLRLVERAEMGADIAVGHAQGVTKFGVEQTR